MLDELWSLVFHRLREVILEGVVIFDDVIIDAHQHHVIDIHKRPFKSGIRVYGMAVLQR